MKVVSRGVLGAQRNSIVCSKHVLSPRQDRCLHPSRPRAVSATLLVKPAGYVDVASPLADVPTDPDTFAFQDGRHVRGRQEWPLQRDDRQPYYKRSHMKSLLQRQKDIAGETLIVALTGEVSLAPDVLADILGSVRIIHGAGARVVLIGGTSEHLISHLGNGDSSAQFLINQMVANSATRAAAIGAAALLESQVEGAMCKVDHMGGLSAAHDGMAGDGHQEATAASVVCGNYVTARRLGIVNGIDHGFAGLVRYVRAGPVIQQLDMRHIVLLTDLGVSMCGETLLCGMHDVALHAAAELKADRVIFVRGGPPPSRHDLGLLSPRMTPEEVDSVLEQGLDAEVAIRAEPGPHAPRRMATNLEAALRTASGACQHGVAHCHIIPAHMPGALLHELFGLGGMGIQISKEPNAACQTPPTPPGPARLPMPVARVAP